MKVLITSDFYTDYELYETEKPNGLKNWVALSMMQPDPLPLNPNVYRLIGTQDEITEEDARSQADEIIYTSDYAYLQQQETADTDEAPDDDQENCYDTPEFWEGLKAATDSFRAFASFIKSNRDAFQELIGVLPPDMSLLDDGIEYTEDALNTYNI